MTGPRVSSFPTFSLSLSCCCSSDSKKPLTLLLLPSLSTDRESDDEDEEEEEDYSGGRGGGRDRNEEENEDGDEDGPRARRSRRATKGQRLAFWMGERSVYQKGKMVSGCLARDKTLLTLMIHTTDYKDPTMTYLPCSSHSLLTDYVCLFLQVGVLIADKTSSASNRRPRQRQVGDKRRQSLLEQSGDKDKDKNRSSGSDVTSRKRGRVVDDSDDEHDGGSGLYRKSGRGGEHDDEMEVVLPAGVPFMSRELGDELSVWDDPSDSTKTIKMICHGESLQPASALPITAQRPAGKDKVGYAAQSFNIPEIPGVMSGWISGFVELPAGAIKDAEGVGECSQVFFIANCQVYISTNKAIISPNSVQISYFIISLTARFSSTLVVFRVFFFQDNAVELGVADPREEEWRDDLAQRVLLRQGDFFFVPPGNIYRLENHSAVRD